MNNIINTMIPKKTSASKDPFDVYRVKMYDDGGRGVRARSIFFAMIFVV